MRLTYGWKSVIELQLNTNIDVCQSSTTGLEFGVEAIKKNKKQIKVSAELWKSMFARSLPAAIKIPQFLLFFIIYLFFSNQ